MVRKARPIATAPRLPIQSSDTVRTGAGRVKIVFVDQSTVSVTEQSKLVIDSFVYDPNPKKSKMALKFASGTVRFATGKGMPKNNINLRTPSATIAVRGTDFTSTVDDFGKSLIILLPEEDGTVGEITVSNAAGTVILNRAFQATMVNTFDSVPSKPVILNLSLDMIDNMMIVSPPEERQEETSQRDSRANLLDLSELDIDFLQTNALSDDALSMDYLKDITFDADRFEDFLATDGLRVMADEKEGVRLTGTTFGFDNQTQIYTILTEDQIRVTRGVNNITDIITPKLQNTLININDSGRGNVIIINNDGGSRIIVEQKN
ncbi:FecR protein [uncultured Caudovirales phage]|uniref:FecR protein n=1 Tax=uncultured Caudovirales phage TaxID=2100421 RepID=A0A6J5MD27_9CAUD|nr:FecR protein [uncultured Caudovirales phage]